MTDKPVIIDSDGNESYGKMMRLAETRVLAIEHVDLSYIRVDFQVSLNFGRVEIVIGCPFVLTVDDVVHRLDPEEGIGLGPLVALYPASLSAAYVTEDAALHVEFDGGATVVVPPDVQYEAWEVHDDRGWRLVCVPGTSGEMAEWTNPQNGP